MLKRKKIIRLQLSGVKKYPLFNIVVILKDKRNKGKFIEKLGFINPNSLTKLFYINIFRLGYWLNKGVILKKTVKFYLTKFAVIYKTRKKSNN